MGKLTEEKRLIPQSSDVTGSDGFQKRLTILFQQTVPYIVADERAVEHCCTPLTGADLLNMALTRVGLEQDQEQPYLALGQY